MQEFRKLDIFKKVPRDISEGTNLGGFISIITVCFILFFLISQISLFIDPPLSANINLDQPFTRKQLNINLDMYFPRLPCELLSLDHQDAMMTHTANIKQIKKFRVDQHGLLIDGADFQLYRDQDQEKQYQMAKEAFMNKCGCKIRGTFKVKEVPGNFHISAHPYAHIYRQLKSQGVIQALDVSHRIASLFFGDFQDIDKIQKKHKGSQLNPLSNHPRIYNLIQPRQITSHYHLQIVPTLFHDILSTVQAYQYTYHHNSFFVNHMSAVYFNYHIGGTRISIKNSRGYVSTFILNLCAVIGGIYAIANIFYNMLWVLGGKKSGYQELVQ